MDDWNRINALTPGMLTRESMLLHALMSSRYPFTMVLQLQSLSQVQSKRKMNSQIEVNHIPQPLIGFSFSLTGWVWPWEILRALKASWNLSQPFYPFSL